MSDTRDEPIYRSLGLSLGAHLALAAVMLIGWNWHADQKTMAPPAMMKASLVYAPKSTMAPQQKTQTQKPEKPKPKPEPPKPEVTKPKEVKPEIKPTDKPSPIAAKPEQPKPKPQQQEQKKQPDKKVEPPKPDAKQAEKKQAALSAIEKEKARKDAEMAIQALLNDEDITRTGELTDDELGKWAGLISSRIEDSNGQVLNVTVVEGSGNKAFDLAAEAAVRKVERFEEITQMKPEVFEKNFRQFSLLFNPEDLLE